MSSEFDKSVKRRDILKAGAVLGLGIPSIGAFLAACSNAASSPAASAAASVAPSVAASTAPSAAASQAASASAAASQAAGGNPVTVLLYDTMPQATQQVWLNTWYPAFQKQYPWVTIKEQNGGIEDSAKLRQLVASNSDASPDMAWEASSEQGAYSDASLLADVDGWLNSKPDIKSNIIPALVKLSSYNGKVATLPWMTNNCAMLINTDAFKEAGVAIPSQDPKTTWTWDDFEAACKAITAKGTMKGFLMSGTTGWDPWVATGWFGTNGAVMLDDTGTAQWNSPAGIETMTYLQGLVKNGYTVPLDKGWELTLWYNKKAAIALNGPWNLPDIQAQQAKGLFAWTTVPFPRKTQAATNIGGDQLYLFKRSADKVAGEFAYAEYLLSDDFQVKFAMQSGNLPVTTSATANADYQAFLQKTPQLLGWVNSVPFGVSRISTPTGSDQYSAFSAKAWDPIILKGADPATALNDAKTASDALKGG
jgi:multiple sugar transport system substrate-binding protein